MLSTLHRLTVRSVASRMVQSAVVRPTIFRSFTTVRSLSATPPSPAEVAKAQAVVRAIEKKQASAAAAAPLNEQDFDENDEDEEYADDDEYDDQDEEGNEEEQIAMVTRPAPEWTATALMPGGTFEKISSEDYLGKWTVLFFYPLDFTFVCPTEIRAFSDRIQEFKKLGVEVIAASVDSEFAHLAWTQQPKETGGLGPMSIPIIADITKNISRSYGILLEDQGISLRGLFIIDPKGILRQSTVNDLPIGRSVDETLRLVQAFQYNEKHGEVCPAGWKPGQDAMSADAAGLKKYFGKK